MLALVEEARALAEAYLGWAMLIRVSMCAKASVTIVTQRRLAEANQLEWPLPAARGLNYIGRYVQRLLLRRLGPVRALANRAAVAPFPIIARPHDSFVGPEPLRRVRVEHVTPWSEPTGRRHNWPDLRTPFRSRGFDAAADWTEASGNIGAPQCWRQVVNRQLTEDTYVQLVATTARFLWHGFHMELVEQTMDLYGYSDGDLELSGAETSSSLRSRSRSPGQRLRRQRQNVEGS